MASNFGDEDMSCSVCFELYSEIGNHVPRILPCYHSLCEKCIRQLISHKKLECPECRSKHEAKHGSTSFKQNKYILTNIRRETKIKEAASLEKFLNIKEKSGHLGILNLETCEKHGKDLSLYCKEDKCQLTICQKCLIRSHVGHDVVDLEEEREELHRKVSEKASFLRTTLEAAKGRILSARIEFDEDLETSLEGLKAQKNKINLLSDKMEREISGDKMDINILIQDKLSQIDEHLVLLGSLENNMNVNTCAETARRLETMNDIETRINKFLSERILYKYRKFQASEPRIMESIFGSLKPKEILVRPGGGNTVERKFFFFNKAKYFYRDCFSQLFSDWCFNEVFPK